MAATQGQAANIWAQMSYTPPRGSCSQKTSLVSTCSCYRFMIHPLKVASSFNCDGCGHHASFHKMDNAMDEEIVKRWRSEEAGREREREREEGYGEMKGSAGGVKRRRIENGDGERRRIEGGQRKMIENVVDEDTDSVDDLIELPRREIAQVAKGKKKEKVSTALRGTR